MGRPDKKTARPVERPAGSRSEFELDGAFTNSLQQTEFLRPADGAPAIVHPEFTVDVLGVGAHGV